MNYRVVVLLTAALLSFTTVLCAGGEIPIDEVPMYGGMDRSTIPELQAGDQKLISDSTKHYGTRQKASAAFVGNGFSYYLEDDLAKAMRRFNQAWLLDPQNPEVYAGFGSVLHDKGKYCEAMQMLEKAITLNPPTIQGIYTDAAALVTLCAVSNSDLTPEAKSKMFERSESLFITAEEIELDKRYVFESWATAYSRQEDYSGAWAMVAKERAAGGRPSEDFLELLRERMPEPK